MILAQNLLAPNWGLFVWMLVTFLALMFVLGKYAWGPITKALEDREKGIQESMDQAKIALEEAKTIQADNTTARKEAEANAKANERNRIKEENRQKYQRVRVTEIRIISLINCS